MYVESRETTTTHRHSLVVLHQAIPRLDPFVSGDNLHGGHQLLELRISTGVVSTEVTQSEWCVCVRMHVRVVVRGKDSGDIDGVLSCYAENLNESVSREIDTDSAAYVPHRVPLDQSQQLFVDECDRRMRG